MNSLITMVAITRLPLGARLDRPAPAVVSAGPGEGNKGEAKSMARVLTVGITVFDTVLKVAAMPRLGGKVYARTRAEVVGGIAANAAIAIVRLGGEALLASRLGADLVGERVMADLVAAGVDTSMVDGLNGVQSAVSAILVDAAGERLLVNHADPALFLGSIDLAGVAVDAVMTDTRWPEAALAALRHARTLGVPGVLDYDSPAERLEAELLEAASHVACGRHGLEDLTGTADVAAGMRAARRLTSAWLACTSGGDGVFWLEGDALRHLPAFSVTAVDTLAAGDVFHGALALGLARGLDEPAAMRFASAAAALKCQRFGGGSVSPTSAEVAAFLRERG
jgi:sulfofructose kinase